MNGSANVAQTTKWAVLALLVAQNAATSVLTRASRAPRADGLLYLGGAAVLMAELLKLPICLALIARDEGGPLAMARAVWRKVFLDWRDTLSMAVPSLCYCLQNLLFYVALSHMTAPAYQLWSQTKTLFTAFFFVSYLGGELKLHQWLSLALLAAGVGWVQCSGAAAVAGLVGIGAVLLSSLLSGFANIYLEKRIKRSETTIWMRNVQLGLFSIPQSASLLLAPATRAAVAQHGLLVGFDPLVWGVVALKAFGGLLVAAVVKYADNILKTFATAISILITCLLSPAGLSPRFLQGMTLVLASLPLYNQGLVAAVGKRLRGTHNEDGQSDGA